MLFCPPFGDLTDFFDSILISMCVNYVPIRPAALRKLIDCAPSNDYPIEVFPGYVAPIIRTEGKIENSTGLRADLAVFGLVPYWSKDRAIGRHTCNARSETVAEKPSYRAAWCQRQYCLVPMEQFYEPCWETGKAVRWSIHRQDREPFTVAAIWDSWADRETGKIVESFSMLTINADGHPIMGKFHRPGDEKRSLAIIPEPRRADWLTACPITARKLLCPMPEIEYAAIHEIPEQRSEIAKKAAQER